MNNSTKTVTIGIPAFNEGKNILYLLRSLLSQEQKSYHIEKIIVISDGSTDDMENKVMRISNQNKLISLVADHQNIGKQKRLMQLYKMNTSDIFVQLDADIVLAHNRVLEELIKPFQYQNVFVASGDRIPLGDKSLVAQLILKKNQMWRELRTSLTYPHTIINCFSCILAMRKSFTKTIILDQNITSESQLVYCETVKRHLEFRFAPKAEIYFNMPATLSDYLEQTKRSFDETNTLIKKYGSQIKHYDEIPTNIRRRIFVSNLVKDPIFTIASLLLFCVLQYFPYKTTEVKKAGFWKIVNSTKKGIDINGIY